MSVITKPMLAATVKSEDLEGLEWPMLASPKIDGIRCIVHPTLGAVTRSFKQVANIYVRAKLTSLVAGRRLDGELVAIDKEGNPLSFNATQSALMSRNGRPEFVYNAFDCFTQPDDPFATRVLDARFHVLGINHEQILMVDHQWVDSPEEFQEYTDRCVLLGYEGAMLRKPDGPYKNGRSTLRQGWLLKYKEWADAEGVIIGFEERMHNANEDIKDNFGYAKRTSHKANMEPTGTLGAFILETTWGELRVGSGFDENQRQRYWDDRQPLLGRVVTFKYQPHGMQDKPRFPIFLGFREDKSEPRTKT